MGNCRENEEELADNSDDEKRLFRAEQRPSRKVKAAAAMSKRKKEFLRKDRKPRAQSGPSISEPAGGLPVVQPSSSAHIRSIPIVQGLGPYFICGKVGSIRKTCPLVKNNTNN